MNIPGNLHYTKDHEWVKTLNGINIIGITDYAQSELGDVIFVEFPKIGADFNSGDTIGTIEAVKTVADIYTPISGRIVEINGNLDENPESINKDPYDAGWIVKIESSENVGDNLLSPSEYKNLIQ